MTSKQAWHESERTRPAAERVGYVVSRFPKTTETFIVREMEAVESTGWHVSLFAIRHERDEILQPGAGRFRDRLTAISDVSLRRAIGAQLRLARRRPGVLARMWWRAIGGNISSRKFLLRALVAAWGAPALADAVTAQHLHRLHAHWGTHSALLAHLISMLTGVPYSITLHAHDLHVEQTMLAEKLSAARDVVTISAHNAELIRRDFPDVAGRTTVVHCGIDTAAIPFEVEPRRNRSARAERLVTVAGLREFKGHRHLLEALNLLRERGRHVACDLVGDGPLREELEGLAGEGVVFHGALDVDAALDVVRAGTLFVMPSVVLADGRRDGIPVALMEAMAIGVPVVATDVSGIPELVRDGDTGLLVPQRDAVALADAIVSLLDDPDRRRTLARNARTLVEQEFDIVESGRAMAELFCDALACGTATP